MPVVMAVSQHLGFVSLGCISGRFVKYKPDLPLKMDQNHQSLSE